MDVATILDRGSIRVAHVGSKKLALDILSQMLSEEAPGVSAAHILEELAGRERLGCTALGDGVAMPHARVPGIDRCIGALLKLTEPIDFDAPDGKPVSLLFGLLVPDGSARGTVTAIRQLIHKLRDPDLKQALEATDDPDALYALLTNNLGAVKRFSTA